VRECLVTTGAGGETHTEHVRADSLFEAAHFALNAWGKLWWYGSIQVLQVNNPQTGQTWIVRKSRVLHWRQEKELRYPCAFGN
jgi:hypothetical protein